MIFVYKKKRTKNGKVVYDKSYRGRYRLEGDFTATDVPLKTSDKQVAQKKLRDIVQEKERERAGLIAPKLQRDSAERPLSEHLKEFVADLRAKGRSKKYPDLVTGRVERLLTECNWKYGQDINENSFVLWRSRQSFAPKTLNEYLNAMSGLLNWMVRQKRISANPLQHVERVDIRGKQQERRAYTDDELARLLEVSEDYRLLYLSAIYTGLRLGELTAIVMPYLHLDQSRAYIRLPASLTKNKKPAVVPLHPVLADEFKKATEGLSEMDFVFPQYAHPDRRLNRHLKRAGIAKIDSAGRKVDFHAFRYTFATKLARQGVSQRLAQELLRHSDPRLTSNLYTDATHLPTFDAIENMPWLHLKGKETDSLMSPPVVSNSVNLSSHFFSSADISGVEFKLHGGERQLDQFDF